MRVYTNSDILGVEICGALKNIIALGAGISAGLGYGDNAKAAIITRGTAEIARLGVAMGCDIKTFYGLAGVGDLIVTCTSMHSRNRRAGVLIGKGLSAEEAMQEVGAVVEGYYAANAAHELAAKAGVETPICEEAYKVLYEGKAATDTITDLMKRAARPEFDDGEKQWSIY